VSASKISLSARVRVEWLTEVHLHAGPVLLPGMQIIGCPECDATAEVLDHGRVASTGGLLDVVKVVCVERHWFLMTRDALPAAPADAA
jgi:hypothetical protein